MSINFYVCSDIARVMSMLEMRVGKLNAGEVSLISFVDCFECCFLDQKS